MATHVTAFESAVPPVPVAPSGHDIPRRAFPQRLLLRTTTTRSKGARRNAFFVPVSLVQFRIWWLVFFAVHSLCVLYFLFFSYMYWVLPGSFTGMTLEHYGVTMPMTRFPVVAAAHALVAVGHAFFLLRMLLGSLWHRRFTFGRPSFHVPKAKDNDNRQQQLCHTLTKYTLRVLRRLNVLWMKAFSRRGFFGIESKHFELLYIARELFESLLQSVQAYRMSLYVPRVMLNRAYVGVMVVNCLFTPAVHFLFEENPPLVRLLCLVLDILLDFASSVAVPIALILPYTAEYDIASNGFEFMLWYDDFWLVNMINEFKLLFVNSWVDFVARIFFSVSLLVAMQNVKSLLRKTNRRINPSSGPANGNSSRSSAMSSFISDREQEDQDRREPTQGQGTRWTSYPPFIQQIAKSVSRRQSTQVAVVRDTSSSASKSMIPPTPVHQPAVSRRIAKLSHLLFPAWGLVLLALHLHGELQRTPAECGLSVRPWFSNKAACSLLQINCKTLNLTCTVSEMDAILGAIDEQTLAHIVIRHCPAVEISPRIRQFSHLVGLKIYNSTLVNWSKDAALTGRHHPFMVFLFLVHVNMSSFPEGLLSDEFPQKLYDIEFSGTNLVGLPADLYLKWPAHSTNINCFEQGLFESVPPVLEHMKTGFLSLVGHRITEIPSYVFTNDEAVTIWLSDNPIEALPEELVPSASIRVVHLASTKLRALPSWMDDAFFQQAVLIAGGSPLCEDILEAHNRLTVGKHSSNRTVNAVALAAFERGFLDCTPASGDYMTYYPSVAEAQLNFSIHV